MCTRKCLSSRSMRVLCVCMCERSHCLLRPYDGGRWEPYYRRLLYAIYLYFSVPTLHLCLLFCLLYIPANARNDEPFFSFLHGFSLPSIPSAHLQSGVLIWNRVCSNRLGIKSIYSSAPTRTQRSQKFVYFAIEKAVLNNSQTTHKNAYQHTDLWGSKDNSNG